MDKRVLVALVVLASAFLFFGLAYCVLSSAFCSLPLLVKVAVLLTELSLTGFVLHKLTKVDAFYGVLIVRSFAGFDVMRFMAKRFGGLARQLCDLGATIAFGFAFGWKVFGLRKAWPHACVLLGFLALLSGFGTTGFVEGGLAFLVVGALFGLAGVGLYGMASHALSILTVPDTPPGVSVLLPGVTLPWEAVVAIAIIAVVHEVAHGVLCYVERLAVQSSGALFLGFIPIGAFVEPDEKKLDRIAVEKKRRILVAGSASNLLFFLVFLVFSLAFSALVLPLSVQGVENSVTSEKIFSIDSQKIFLSEQARGFFLNASNPNVLVEGENGSRQMRLLDVVFVSVSEKGPAFGKVNAGDVLRKVDGVAVYSVADLASAIALKKPGESLLLETNSSIVSVVLSQEKKIGVTVALKPVLALENVPVKGFEWLYAFFALLSSIFWLTALLNLLIGIVNLLPLFITDGHKLLYYEFVEWFGKKKAEKLSIAVGVFTLLLLALNALPWFLK